MRNYPRNSSQAAARIVALVLIADGHVSRTEIDALHRLHIEQTLGLPAGGFGQVVHSLCEDLLAASHMCGGLSVALEGDNLHSVMDEVDDADLRRTVLRLARAAADSDSHMADAEVLLIEAVQARWPEAAAPEQRVLERVD